MSVKTRGISSSAAASSSSASRARPTPYARNTKTAVKRLPHLQKGRFETILLPASVPSSSAASAVKSVARPAEEEDLKKKQNNIENIKVIKTEDNSMIFVKDAAEDYEEYAGSTDDEDYTATRRTNRINNAAPAPPAKVVDFQGTAVFILALLHALDCGGCSDIACKKMRLVLGHFLSCSRKNNQGCSVCAQLINIVGQHAKHLCRARENGRPCPVPMCDAIRKEMAGEHEAEIAVEI